MSIGSERILTEPVTPPAGAVDPGDLSPEESGVIS
jgi:hypothetical protein